MNGEWRTIFKRNPCETFPHKRKTEGKCSLGKVTISTVLGYKEYGVENPRERFGIYRFSKDSVTFWDKLENKAMDPIRI